MHRSMKCAQSYSPKLYLFICINEKDVQKQEIVNNHEQCLSEKKD